MVNLLYDPLQHRSVLFTWASISSHLCVFVRSESKCCGVQVFSEADAIEFKSSSLFELFYIEEDLLFLLGFGVDVSQHGDVREVYPELAEQSGHPVLENKKKKHKTKAFELDTGKQLGDNFSAVSHPEECFK